MKKLIAIVLAVVMVLGLAACSVSEKPAETKATEAPKQTEGTEATQATEAAPANVEISLWTFPVGKWGDEATVNQLLADFNAAHPEITVKVEYLAYGGDGDAKIDSAIEGGQAPDLVFEGPERLVTGWGARGVMADLSDLWTDEIKADMVPAVEAACRNNDGIYYEFPVCMTAHCMAINKTVFEEAGAMQYIDEENHTWTTEGFINAVNAVYDYTGSTVGAVFCNGAGGDQGNRALISNLYSGTFTTADHTAWTTDSEEIIKALELLVDLKGIDFDASINGAGEADLFAQGVLKMATCWNLSNYNQRKDVIDFEVLPMNFPSDDGVAELCGGIWGFGIFDNGDAARIEAAKTFVKFMTQDNAVAAVKASGFSSPRLSQTDVYAGAENIDDIKLYESFLPNMGDYYNVMTGWTQARTMWAETLQAIGTGTDVTEALTTFTNNANALG